MPNPSKAKGNLWEAAVLKFLRENGLPRSYKPRQESGRDIGDLHAADAVLQAKDWKSWEAAIREGLDGAVLQAAAWDERAGTNSVPAAVVKRARRPVGDAYVVLRLSDFVRLLWR